MIIPMYWHLGLLQGLLLKVTKQLIQNLPVFAVKGHLKKALTIPIRKQSHFSLQQC